MEAIVHINSCRPLIPRLALKERIGNYEDENVDRFACKPLKTLFMG
jgi:hypothetical protein